MSTPRTEPEALVLRTAALWGTFVLAAKELRGGESLALGEGENALVAKPDASPVSDLPIRAVGNGWELDPSGATGGRLHLRGRAEEAAELGKRGAPVAIVAGDYGVLQYGSFSVFFQFAHPAPVPRSRWRPDLPLLLAFLFAVITLGGTLLLLYLLFPQQILPKPLELTSPEELQKQYHFTPPPPEASPGGGESEGAKGAKAKEPKAAAGTPQHAPGPKTSHPDTKSGGQPGAGAPLSAMTEVMQGAVGKQVLETLGSISSVSDALGGLRAGAIQFGGRGGGKGLHASGEGGGQGGSALFGGGTLDTGDGSGSGVAGTGRGRARGHGLGTGDGDGSGRGGERHLQAASATAPGQGLSEAQIRRVIMSREGAYRACYETALAREPALKGGVTVSFQITPSGSVSGTHIANTSLNNGRVESCLLRVFGRLKFPASDHATNVPWPLIFNPTKR